jgi:hypothetical protein
MKPTHAELRPASSGGWFARLRWLLGGGGPTVRVSATATVRLGAPLEVEWRVEPSRGATLVTVSLVGSEIARRRISARTGISVVAERSDFFVAELDRRVPQSGAASVAGEGATTVPAGLVPSLAAKFNDVAWAVSVEILRGAMPSLRQEFPLTMLPKLP